MPVKSSGVTEGDKILTSGITLALLLLEGRMASLTWGDLALPLLLEASEELLELPRLLDLPMLFGGLSVRLKRLASLLRINLVPLTQGCTCP
jgi:hypothetical protein